jgi:hypothetical protein
VGNNLIWESAAADVTRWTASYPGGLFRAAAFGDDTFVTVGSAGVVFTKQIGAPVIDPLAAAFGAGADSGTIAVTAPSGCPWTAATADGWLHINSGASGAGNGTVNYSVDANAGGARSGSIAVAGLVHSVSQAGAAPCGYSVTPTKATFQFPGGPGTIQVTTSGASCPWNATPSAGWITITSGASGTGSGQVGYSVSANQTGAARVGTISIAGQTHAISQYPANYSISPLSASFGYSGGGGAVTVSASTGAYWTAVSNDSWITVTAGGSGTGPGSVTYTVAANNTIYSRTGTVTIAGLTHTVSQAAPVFSISPASRGFGSGAATGTITVTASPGLSWTASESLGWVSITSGASGSGNGTVTYSVGPNSSGEIRSGSIRVGIGGGSLYHEVAQAPAGFDITPYSRSFAAWSLRPGNEGTITVTVPNGISWNALAGQAWITILSGSSGSGSGTITYQVANNSSLDPRNGYINIGNALTSVRHMVSQAGAGFSVSPVALNAGAPGGAESLTVTATTGVPWTAASSAGWITITSGSSGTGSGTVGFNVAANTVTSSRAGTISVGGETVTVSQAGVTPEFSISPTERSFPSAGGPGDVAVTGTAGFPWTSQSHASWITITSGGSGSGNGTLHYSVAVNPNTTSRTGTLTVAGETHTVNQAGLNPYSVSPSSQSYTHGGGTLIITVGAQGGAAWTAVSDSTWIQVTSNPPGGAGNGTFAYHVDANVHVDGRSGQIRVGSAPHYAYHTVNQGGAPVTYSISPVSVTVPGPGGSRDVTVTATAGVPWTASTPPAWISYAAGSASGTGSGLVSYTVEPNATTSSRAATLTIAGKPHQVTQQSGDAPLSCTLSPSTVWENEPAGTLVGYLATTSYVAIASPTFELYAVPGIDDNGAFIVSGNQLRTAEGFDADAKDQYQLGVRVGNGHGDYFTGIVAVAVINDWLEDADGDGLPEDEEARHCTSDQMADADGDGLPDGVEINITGTDPLDGASSLRIGSVDRIGNTIRIGWESVAGKTYHMLNSAEAGDWSGAAEEAVQAVSTWTEYAADITGPARFFRLTVSSPRVSEAAKLAPGDLGVLDLFGEKIALNGDTLVVGAKFNDDGGLGNCGSAYVYQRDHGGPGNWGLVKRLLASDRAAGDLFGYAVSIDGNTIVVGADSDNSRRGAAYIFERNAGGADNWGEVRKLVASDGVGSDYFGYDAKVRGDRIVVGSLWDDSRRGAAYIFERNAGGSGNWGEVRKLTAADRADIDEFGTSVDLYGNTIVVGAHFDDEMTTNAGAVYVFERDLGGTGNWGQAKKVTAFDGGADDQFGENVSLFGDTLAVSAPNDDDRAYNAGAVYLIERNQGGADQWGLVRKIHAPDGAAWDLLGVGMDLDGDRLVVGAWASDAFGDKTGSAYLFHRDWNGPGRWGLVQRFLASDAAVESHFGWRVAISGQTLAIGAPQDDEVVENGGACYIYYDE